MPPTRKLLHGDLPMLMSVARFFFSFNGRMGRLAYAPASLSLLTLLAMAELATRGPWQMSVLAWPVAYCLAALNGKRLHDLGHSARYLWLFLAPAFVFGTIACCLALGRPASERSMLSTLNVYRGLWLTIGWPLVWPLRFACNFYFLFARGTAGDNPYGPSTRSTDARQQQRC